MLLGACLFGFVVLVRLLNELIGNVLISFVIVGFILMVSTLREFTRIFSKDEDTSIEDEDTSITGRSEHQKPKLTDEYKINVGDEVFGLLKTSSGMKAGVYKLTVKSINHKCKMMKCTVGNSTKKVRWFIADLGVLVFYTRNEAEIVARKRGLLNGLSIME